MKSLCYKIKNEPFEYTYFFTFLDKVSFNVYKNILNKLPKKPNYVVERRSNIVLAGIIGAVVDQLMSN